MNFIQIRDPIQILISLEETCINIYKVEFFYDVYDDNLFNKYNIPPIDRFHEVSIRRKAEYLAGRIAASLALNSLGRAEFNLHAGEDGCPVWPKNIFGSISHTNKIAIACAIQNNDTIYSSIGIDIEPIISEKKQNLLQIKLSLIMKLAISKRL